MQCVICGGKRIAFAVDRTSYLQCSHCEVISMAHEDLPDLQAERKHYSLHENSIENQGYVDFLSRFIEQFASVLESGASGLDFGCGPDPTLAALLELRGFRMVSYDPIFFDSRELLSPHKYDFVSCCEVVEHFHNPLDSWVKLVGLVKPGGVLAVRTEFHRGVDAFRTWHYRRDPTHVTFYNEVTLRWIADAVKFEVLQINAPYLVARVK